MWKHSNDLQFLTEEPKWKYVFFNSMGKDIQSASSKNIFTENSNI